MWLTLLLVIIVAILYVQLQKLKAEMADCCKALADLYQWARDFRDAVVAQVDKCGCPQDPKWPPEGPGDWPDN